MRIYKNNTSTESTTFLELDKYIFELVRGFCCWDSDEYNRNLDEIIPNMLLGLEDYEPTEKEKEIVIKINKEVTLLSLSGAELSGEFRKVVDNYLQQNEKKDELLKEYLNKPDLIDEYIFEKYFGAVCCLQDIKEIKDQVGREISQKIFWYLEKNDNQTAEKLYEAYKNVLPDSLREKIELEKERIKKEASQSRDSELITSIIEPMVKHGQVKEALGIAKTLSNPSRINELLEKDLLSFISKEKESNNAIPPLDDPDKIEAIINFSDSLLIKARAGSGKTQTLTLKVFYLIKRLGISPNNIVFCSFNSNVAKEIKNKMHDIYNLPNFENSFTFHSLANKILHSDKVKLFDDKEQFTNKNLSSLVQSIIKEMIKIQNVTTGLYKFFRKELSDIEFNSVRSIYSKNEYVFRKSYYEVSLNGERVKSRGEKYIADYLFEHGINYIYEKYTVVNGQSCRPDFILYKNEGNTEEFVVLEYLGMLSSSDETFKAKYIEELEWKRAHWKEQNVSLIEVHPRDLVNGREHFEILLETTLVRYGFKSKKLPMETLIKKVLSKNISDLTKNVTSFIGRSQKLNMSTDQIEGLITKTACSERTKLFCNFSLNIYKEYKKTLEDNNLTDFDEIIKEAIEKIYDTKGSAEIRFHDYGIKIKDIEFLLIDEYQDFSKLFYELIHTIRNYNPNIKLICVGDDWQAINSFAGSDLDYFLQFEKIFNGAFEIDLLTNYRCKSEIVEKSNKLMKGLGLPANAKNEKGGQIRIIPFSEALVKDEDYTLYNLDKEYIPNRYIIKYLKICKKIILLNLGKTFLIMDRTNQIHHVDLNQFAGCLKESFTTNEFKEIARDTKNDKRVIFRNYDDVIKVDTIHSFKGCETDVAIILEATQSNLPLLNPDNLLFEPFGATMQKALEEEKRLFYVAITRPKEKLFLITEEKNESEYLSIFKS